MKTTTELVTAYRTAHGGTDRKAAPHVGVSQTTFSLWASGEEFPSEERVEGMARAIGADVELALVILRRTAPGDAHARLNNNFFSSNTQYTLRQKRRGWLDGLGAP